MGWTRTGTEVLHEGAFVSLRRDAVLRPDGSAGIYEHVSVDDGVRVVALDEQGRVLIVEDDFYLQQRRMPHLPGGGISGEEPHEAALRELQEETGFIAGELRCVGVIDSLPSTTTARTHLFLATRLRPGTLRRDDTEIGMTVHRWEFADAVEAVRTGRITEAGSVSALLLAALDRGP